MFAIDDNALILHHYGEDETPEQRERIARALQDSPDLRGRYARLQRLLMAVDQAPAPLPPADLARRLWQGIEPRLHAAPPPATAAHVRAVPSHGASVVRPHGRRRVRAPLRVAMAASVLLLLGAGFLAGRLSMPDVPVPMRSPVAATETADPLLAARVLDVYVAAHLRQTEGVLLTALNSDSPELAAGNADLASALVASNRLYIDAAARAGNVRLADFLRQMEPVLIELANPPRGDAIEVRDGLRDYVRETDLLFQVRATEGALASRRDVRA